MSTSILIYGESGTGKSTSLRNLPAEETFIIAAINKPLPFRGWKTKYLPVDMAENGGYSFTTGNYLVNDSCNIIIATLNAISTHRPDIKNIIIDDFQYIMSNQYMRRATEKGWEKFTDIGESTWRVIARSSELRPNLKVFFLAHSDTQDGRTKLKTIGKMLDEKVCIEGMFTIVLNSTLVESQYVFITQNNGNSIAKSPQGMFNTLTIPNDLRAVISSIDEYESADENDSLITLYAQLEKANSIEILRETTKNVLRHAKLMGFSDKFINTITEYATKLSENFKPKEEKTNE
jgi:AAA domain